MLVCKALKYAVFAGPRTWIEGKAVDQLKKSAELPGIEFAAGMPDLHPGRGLPVGAVWRSSDDPQKIRLYPVLIGNDIGCGMALWKLSTETRTFKPSKFASKLTGLDAPPFKSDYQELLKPYEGHPFEKALGTIGGGNHFAEILTVDTLYRDGEDLGLEPDCLYLAVHSGSRGFGEDILFRHIRAFGREGLSWESEEAHAYMALHDEALAFARTNRRLIAQRFMKRLRADGLELLDIAHNYASFENGRLMHRKGAVSMDHPLAHIPGSRGDFTFVVRPTPEVSNPLALNSLSHGAGRKWMRSECRGRLEKRYRENDLRKTDLGSVVVCENRDLLYEEAPQAYKSVEDTVTVLEAEGLCRRVARLRPLLTYKTMRR